MNICTPIGTRVPYRHTVCRSYKPIYQGDKSKSAHFAIRGFVPICADAGIVQLSRTMGKTSKRPGVLHAGSTYCSLACGLNGSTPKRHCVIGCHFGTCAKRNVSGLVGRGIQCKPQLSNGARIAAYANLKRNAGMALAIRFLQIPRSKQEFATRTLRN